MTRPFLVKTVFLATLLAIACASAPAHAKGFVLITYGDDIDFVHDLTSEAREQIGANVALGYKYSSFGVFFLDIWRWGGEYVLYEGTNYSSIADMEITDEQLTAITGVASKSELGRPWSYRLPPGLIVLVLAGGVFGLFWLKNSRHEARLRGLFADERYRHAVDQMRPSDASQAPWTFDQAVDYLMDQRIPADEAKKNLSDLIEATDARQGGDNE